MINLLRVCRNAPTISKPETGREKTPEPDATAKLFQSRGGTMHPFQDVGHRIAKNSDGGVRIVHQDGCLWRVQALNAKPQPRLRQCLKIDRNLFYYIYLQLLVD